MDNVITVNDPKTGEFLGVKVPFKQLEQLAVELSGQVNLHPPNKELMGIYIEAKGATIWARGRFGSAFEVKYKGERGGDVTLTLDPKNGSAHYVVSRIAEKFGGSVKPLWPDYLYGGLDGAINFLLAFYQNEYEHIPG